jgi:hypothetical protein
MSERECKEWFSLCMTPMNIETRCWLRSEMLLDWINSSVVPQFLFSLFLKCHSFLWYGKGTASQDWDPRRSSTLTLGPTRGYLTFEDLSRFVTEKENMEERCVMRCTIPLYNILWSMYQVPMSWVIVEILFQANLQTFQNVHGLHVINRQMTQNERSKMTSETTSQIIHWLHSTSDSDVIMTAIVGRDVMIKAIQ